MIDVQCAVQSVVYNKLYSVQYNELHTLKNFRRGQLKNHPHRIPRNFGHCTAHSMVY